MTEPAQAQQQMCGDGYPFPYTTVQGSAGERRCELQPGHVGYHLWQQCQWPPAQQQDAAAVDLQAVMDKLTSSGQWSRADVVPLANEINSLRAQLATAEAEREALEQKILYERGIATRHYELLKAAEAERGEERRNASRLFDELRAENEAMRDVVEAAREYCSNITWNRGPLKAAVARLDEQHSTSVTES